MPGLDHSPTLSKTATTNGGFLLAPSAPPELAAAARGALGLPAGGLPTQRLSSPSPSAIPPPILYTRRLYLPPVLRLHHPAIQLPRRILRGFFLDSAQFPFVYTPSNRRLNNA